MTLSSLTFNANAAINVPLLTSTSSVALQTGSLIINGVQNSLQLYFPQTSIANGTYRLLTYSGSIGGVGDGFGAFLVVQPPTLGSRSTGNLVNNSSGQEIDYTVVGQTPYWNGQQPDWQTTNAWTLQPSGSLTSFQSQDNDVFDNTVATGSYSNAVTINQGNVNPISATFNNATSAYTISGSNGIIGPGYLQINGAGGLTINNSNGYTGGTRFNAGTLNINNPSAIGSGTLTIAGGTLGNTSGATITLPTNNTQAWNADFTFAGPNDLNLGTGAVTLSGSRTVTLTAGVLTVGGPIGGVGASLTVTGTGGLVLGGANSYNSGTIILGGNVTASDPNSPLGSGPVAISPAGGSATLTLSGAAAAIGALTMSPAAGTATLNLTGATTTIGALSSGGAGTSTIVLGNAANSSATTLAVNEGTSTTFGGNIADMSQTNSAAAGSLVVNGPGTLTLAGSNTYTGSTTVSGGVLQLGSASALYAGSAIGNAIVDGTLDLNGNNANVAGLSGGGTVLSSVPGAATLTAGYNNAASTYSGMLQASLLALTKTGSGALVLTGQDNAPTTTVSQGTLQMNTVPAAAVSGSVSIAGGATFQENCQYFPLLVSGGGTWNIDVGPSATGLNFVSNSASNCNMSGFTGTTNILSGNRYWLAAQSNIPSGPIVVASGGQFGIGYDGIATANLSIAGSSWAGGDNNGALRLNSGNNGSGGNFAGTLTLDANAGVAVNAGAGGSGIGNTGSGTISANISGPYQLTVINGTITFSGTNSLGSLSIAASAGAIASYPNLTAFGGGGPLVCNGTAQLNGNSLTVANLTGGATGVVENGPNAAAPRCSPWARTTRPRPLPASLPTVARTPFR